MSLERAEPATLDEAFSIALREDVRVTKAYTKPSVVTVVRPSGPEPMEIDVIESSGDRRRVTSCKGDARTGRQMICFVAESQNIARQSVARQRRYRPM